MYFSFDPFKTYQKSRAIKLVESGEKRTGILIAGCHYEKSVFLQYLSNGTSNSHKKKMFPIPWSRKKIKKFIDQSD